MTAHSFLYLSADALAGLTVTAEETIDCIEMLLRGRAESKVWNAPKVTVEPPDGRYIMATLSVSDDPPLLAVKSLVLNERNLERGLPQINSLITVLDSETGLPAAVMDGNWVTAIRTAGLSAVAAKRMARPDSAVLAFIGCGVQAQSHLRIFAEMFPLTEIRAFGRGRPNIDALCKSAEGLGLAASASASAEEAVTGADLIVSSVTLSPRPKPFVDAGWLKPGAFAAVTDLAAPWIADSLAAFDRIVIDDVEQEATMPNRLVSTELIAGDLGELVRGKVKGRGSEQERTAFIFRGHPLGDLALAALAYKKAREDARGTTISG